MYGTVAKMDVLPGKRDELKALIDSQMAATPVAGYIKSYGLMENDTDTLWVTVLFQDKDSYMANADDPAQNERYMAMRALLASDPEWHDGTIEEG